MKFKRVLVCANYPSEPDKGSGGRRLLDLIQLLCADGCKVWFFAANAAAGPGLRRMLQRRDRKSVV